jgi:predicted transcriptional regulator
VARARVTDAELAVLKQLWDGGAATIRELADRLYPGGRASHYATVQKLLERLEAKSYVEREVEGRAHVFAAAVSREELISGELRETADKLCEGSLAPLLTQIVGSLDLEGKEIDRLRALVARIDGEVKGGRR